MIARLIDFILSAPFLALLVPAEKYPFSNDQSEAAHSVFDVQWVRDLGRQITEHLQANIRWIGVGDDIGTLNTEETDAPVRKMLDYACGNGVASRVCRKFSQFSLPPKKKSDKH